MDWRWWEWLHDISRSEAEFEVSSINLKRGMCLYFVFHRRGPPSFDVLKRYVEKISPITSLIDERIQVLS